jgi:hypothetical protein
MELTQAWANLVALARAVQLNADQHDVRQASIDMIAAKLFPPVTSNGSRTKADA